MVQTDSSTSILDSPAIDERREYRRMEAAVIPPLCGGCCYILAETVVVCRELPLRGQKYGPNAIRKLCSKEAFLNSALYALAGFLHYYIVVHNSTSILYTNIQW